jgi:hypothetical protein
LNLDAVELDITLMDHFIISVLKQALSEPSHSMYHSANNKTADEGARRWHCLSHADVPSILDL